MPKGIVRPARRDRLGQVGVRGRGRLAVLDDRRRGRMPVLDRDRPGEAALDVEEEPRGHRQRLLADAPQVGGKEQVGAGPGDGDVSEPALLGDGMPAPLDGKGLDRGAESLAVGAGTPVEPREAVAVAPQVVGKGVQPDEPALVLRGSGAAVLDRGVRVGCLPDRIEWSDGRRAVVREGALDEARDRDDVPFEPLGRVHREDLDGVTVRLDGPGVEPPLLLAGCLEPGEEPGERGAVRAHGVARGDVGEGVEVHAGRRSRVLRTREDLDVESDGGLGLRHHVDERQGRESA